ncbi:Glucose-repressible alcohol dehydrogenase transcriptional effector [Tetrabaena socialis]|uniref:Glucose-repressible alcohol dehydrogenase transcriptional effector n=1 Tax=Tetrabaena socialis TaxID=47790 RepID=A0A2J7ZQM9_9CHLO|nr:Glucose-repressible alcohol dehydrogenase transcriptional effector [Tetrabaena socialis]|eukprot:PNH02578.1 Glucose-repressible alcohol dehydrogenase transcriptional effector [Tetrabaena socialis]
MALPGALGPLSRTLLPAQHLLKVVSYNILAPKYQSYNSYCPPQFLAWEYRRELVLRELEAHRADVVALQVGVCS